MFRFGVDYYPEQWPEERWPEDARLMKETGFNIVRLAEFSWAKLEPEDGRFDFDWLDRAIDTLQEQGLSVILGTPTASPPPWLVRGHPEVLRVRSDGLRVPYGFRRMNCPTSSIYREYGRRITSELAAHFGEHPALVGWQIDNEFGERCYCPVCQADFQAWLRRRYGSLGKLNQSWGTVFWSHIYRDWEEIPLPLDTLGGPPNPGLALDYRRFVSDAYVSFEQEQIELLRAKSPGRFVTHNLMGFTYDGLNYFDLAGPLDFVSWDNYPSGFWEGKGYQPAVSALNHAAMHGLKQKNFWVMEQQAGPSGWETLSPAPLPGQLRLWAYQSIAHGADGILFFRWRTARYGAEQYWHGLLEHDGRAGRRYAEAKRMGLELVRIGGKLEGSTVRSQVAMLQSYDTRFAFQVQPNAPGFSYEAHLYTLYKALWERQVPVDVVSPQADLSPYKLVIAPALHVLTGEMVERLERYVASGGTLLVTPRTGVKDAANAVVDLPLPGLLAGLCGTIVEEYDTLPAGSDQSIVFGRGSLEGRSLPAKIWCDVLLPSSAATVATYQKGDYAGKPAVTANAYGSGQAVYVGTLGDEDFYGPLLDWLLPLISVQPLMQVPPGVEVTERWQGDEPVRFVLNHTPQSQSVTFDQPFLNLLNGEQVKGQVSLAPFDVLVLARELPGAS